MRYLAWPVAIVASVLILAVTTIYLFRFSITTDGQRHPVAYRLDRLNGNMIFIHLDKYQEVTKKEVDLNFDEIFNTTNTDK